MGKRLVELNAKHISKVGGCDELYALDREGKLDGMLAGEKANS